MTGRRLLPTVLALQRDLRGGARGDDWHSSSLEHTACSSQAAVAEAGFMTGLERNSEVVQMAAYAPLFVHANFVNWPTNLIVIDNHRRALLCGPPWPDATRPTAGPTSPTDWPQV